MNSVLSQFWVGCWTGIWEPFQNELLYNSLYMLYKPRISILGDSSDLWYLQGHARAFHVWYVHAYGNTHLALLGAGRWFVGGRCRRPTGVTNDLLHRWLRLHTGELPGRRWHQISGLRIHCSSGTRCVRCVFPRTSWPTPFLTRSRFASVRKCAVIRATVPLHRRRQGIGAGVSQGLFS